MKARLYAQRAVETHRSARLPARPSARLYGCSREKAKTFSESQVQLFVNAIHYTTFLCTPQQYEELALGHLLTTGRIRSREDVLRCEIPEDGHTVHIQVSPSLHDKAPPLRRGLTGFAALGEMEPEKLAARPLPLEQALFSFRQLEDAAAEMIRRAVLYRRTGGMHSAAFSDGTRVLCCEDAGRCNALDKAIGSALLHDMRLSRSFVMLTGRIALEMLLKVVAAKIPIVASLNIPSDAAVNAAQRMGITVIGKMLKQEQHIYTHPQRVG